MYLKKLEIKGFKSFADKIELDFENGITAVVGPNGSGKSNISDAIKWVLGEQSAKTLRGIKMEDIIFAGTEKRGALGFAEVSLIIDNQDKMIDFEYSEITVKRRLYRTGESEYSINGTQCRLRDILEVFMDTGIGKDGYSLIGQGKIDEILSTKSEDRRHIFEEAAGIVKYKARKNEAERKLENTKQNLLRVDDIIEELEGQIEPLKDQSESAKKFLALRDSLKEIEINLIAHNYKNLSSNLEKAKLEENKVQNTKNEYENKKQGLSADYEALKESIEKIEKESQDANKNIIEMEKNFENKQGLLKLLNERHDNTIKDRERIKEEIEEEKSLIDKINIEKENIEKDKTEKQKKLKEVEEKLKEVRKNFDLINKNSMEYESVLENKKSEAIQILRDLSEVTNKLNACEINFKNLDSRISQISREKEIKNQRKEEYLNLISNLEKSIESLKKDKENESKVLGDTRELIRKIENDAIILNKERSSIFDLLKQREAKMKTLVAMENDMEGFSRAVKSVINKYSNKEEVFGTINEIIEVPNGFETAVEIALASSLQNIVVKNENIAREAIEFLKQNRLGRATFYPLTTIKGRNASLDSKIESLKGFKGIASNIVRFDNKFINVITNLLGRVIICDNLINAREIANKTDYRYRIVTLDGDVINSGGSYTGGSNNIRNGGLISRKNTIKTLENEIKEYSNKFIEIEGLLKSKKAELDIKKNQIEEKNKSLQDILNKLNNENNNINNINQNINILLGELKDLSVEIEQIEYEKNKNKDFSKTGIEEKQSLSDLEKKINHEIEELNIKFKDKNIEKENIYSEITNIKVKITEISKSIEGINSRIHSLNDDERMHSGKILMLSNKLENMKTGLVKTQEETKETIKELQLISKSVIDTKNKIHEIESNKKELHEKRDSKEKEIRKLDETLRDILETIHRFDLQKSKFEIERDNLKNKLWDDYEVSIAEAIQNQKEIKNIQEEVKKVNSIKVSIKELGNININAIEEYKKVVERYDFLKTQKEDLINAEESLASVIMEITEKMKNQFTEKFKIMRENFNETFKELFEGGYADLRMEGEDPLTSGIEIIVQPPGKKLQNLTLLSGGERGLSAIALVFAILKMKPTPFCILDEIEAALDDANVNRYAKFLREYSKKTQFIIITHRKGSMAVADSLYGVTMEEKGVSKIVSLKLQGGN